jgi:hypothetical protein
VLYVKSLHVSTLSFYLHEDPGEIGADKVLLAVVHKVRERIVQVKNVAVPIGVSSITFLKLKGQCRSIKVIRSADIRFNK